VRKAIASSPAAKAVGSQSRHAPSQWRNCPW
jgi:hypothetical protein